MSAVQLLITLIVPFFMWSRGRKLRNGNVPYKKKRGVRYSSKRAKTSEAAWTFANDLYFNILRMSGINLALISIVLFIIVVLKAQDLLWTLVFSLLSVQLLAGLILPAVFTELFLRRTFDDQGNLIRKENEEDDDAEENQIEENREEENQEEAIREKENQIEEYREVENQSEEIREEAIREKEKWVEETREKENHAEEIKKDEIPENESN